MSHAIASAASGLENWEETQTARSRTMGATGCARGATRIVERRGRDVPPGRATAVPDAAPAADGESVLSVCQVWPDRAARDRARAAIGSASPLAAVAGTQHGAGRMTSAAPGTLMVS